MPFTLSAPPRDRFTNHLGGLHGSLGQAQISYYLALHAIALGKLKVAQVLELRDKIRDVF